MVANIIPIANTIAIPIAIVVTLFCVAIIAGGGGNNTAAASNVGKVTRTPAESTNAYQACAVAWFWQCQCKFHGQRWCYERYGGEQHQPAHSGPSGVACSCGTKVKHGADDEAFCCCPC